MKSETVRLALESITDSYVFYNGDCSCDIWVKCKFCNFKEELDERLQAVDRYISQLEAQISRDRESLIKDGEIVKKYLGNQREWINE